MKIESVVSSNKDPRNNWRTGCEECFLKSDSNDPKYGGFGKVHCTFHSHSLHRLGIPYPLVSASNSILLLATGTLYFNILTVLLESRSPLKP